MTEIEKTIWASVFAGSFLRDYEFYYKYGNGTKTIDDIYGFSCAEIADEAVEKYREAIFSEDVQHLLIAKEEK